MKKIKIFTILVLLISLCSLASCKRGFKTSLKYADLKKIAYDTSELQATNYNISGQSISAYDNMQMINCNGSQLAYYQPVGSASYSVINLVTGSSLQVNSRNYYLMNNYLSDYSFSTNSNGIFYNSSLPIVVMETNGGYIKVFDHTGRSLYTSNYAMSNTTYFSVYSSSYNHYHISFSGSVSGDYYFRYTSSYKDGRTIIDTVETITESQFNNPSKPQEDEDDDLYGLYNSKGKVYAYISLRGSELFIYNSKKQFVNNVDIESFGFYLDEEPIILENKIIFYANEEYYAKEDEKSYKTTYKCRTLEINLKNGKVKYNDNFKYYILSSMTVSEEIDDATDEEAYKYRGCVVVFNKLNKKGEREDVKQCVILKNSFSFLKTYVYDGFGEVYQLDKKTLLVEYDSGDYIVTKKNKQSLKGLNIVGTSGDGSALVRDNDTGNYGICPISQLVDFSKNPQFDYKYASSSLYNGRFITITYNNGIYRCGDQILDDDYVSYAQSGIIVTSSGILIGGYSVVSFGGRSLYSINQMGYSGDHTFYKVQYNDGTYGYFCYTRVKA